MRPISEIQVRFSLVRPAVMWPAALVLLGCLVAPALTDAPAVSAAERGAAGAEAPPMIVTLAPAAAAGEAAPCVSGARLVRIDGSGSPEVLSGALEAACDPALDPQADRLVYRGRETASAPWRIWSLDLASGASEPITPGERSCEHPLVLADGGIGFLCGGDVYRTAPEAAPGAAPGADPGRGAAAEPVRLTSSGGAIDGVALLPDGRLLLTTKNGAGMPVLLTSQPDGTWATRWRDDPVPGLTAVRPLPPDQLLLAVAPAAGRAGGLWLGSLTDPFAALRPAGENGTGGATLRDPSPLPGGGALAAFRPSPGKRFHIVRLTLAGGAPEEVAVLDGDALQPVALEPRAADTQIPSIVKPELNTGYLVLFDALRSDEAAFAGIDRGDLAAVRVFPWADGPSGESAVDVTPDADGSLYLEVPADRPLGLALIGRSGALLGPPGGPFWVRPNERRACMGCHVSRRYAPPNERPQALLAPPQWVGWGAERVSPRSEFEEGSH